MIGTETGGGALVRAARAGEVLARRQLYQLCDKAACDVFGVVCLARKRGHETCHFSRTVALKLMECSTVQLGAVIGVDHSTVVNSRKHAALKPELLQSVFNKTQEMLDSYDGSPKRARYERARRAVSGIVAETAELSIGWAQERRWRLWETIKQLESILNADQL